MQKTQRKMKQRKHGVDKAKYPPNWKDIAEATKDAAHWRCARCMHPHETTWKVQGLDPTPCDIACRHDQDGKQRMLTVHHLDMNKANVAWWNLAPLCQVCHLQVQARLDWHQYYMLEHSHWMRPYLKGWSLYQVTGMTVVNVNHAPFDQYIGRPTSRLRRKYSKMDLDNPWGNPIRIRGTVTREQAVAEYRPYMVERMREDPQTYNLTKLIGHRIGCSCKPLGCHGDVLIELAAYQVIEATGDRYAEFLPIISGR